MFRTLALLLLLSTPALAADYTDVCWYGATTDVHAALTTLGWSADGSGQPQYAAIILSPELDGQLWAKLRWASTATIPTPPAGVRDDKPQTCTVIDGVWMDGPSPAPSQDTTTPAQ